MQFPPLPVKSKPKLRPILKPVGRPKFILPKPTPKVTVADVGRGALSMDEATSRILTQIYDEANSIEDPHTRELWLDAVYTFASTGNVEALTEVCKWRRKVVDIDEFMFNKAYMALNPDEQYQAVTEAARDLDTGQYIEAVLKGAIGTGKTTLANLMLAREIYKLSCMRHPQSTFGIQAKSSIVFTIQSVRLNTAKKAVFEEFGKYLHDSPYFSKIYPFDPRVTSSMIFREQNVTIMPCSSSTTGAISMNVIGGILDEANFMLKITQSKSSAADADGVFDQAKQLYETLSRRRESRFQKRGKLPGILFLVSSSRFPDDFTERKARESTMCGGQNSRIYVYSHSQWSAKGREHFLPESFRVQVGNDRVRTRVLADSEEPTIGCRVLEVPEDFRNRFIEDPDGSLRDIAGETTLATHPFIMRRDSIRNAMLAGTAAGYGPILPHEQVDLSLGMPRAIRENIRKDVTMWRHCHVDLGLKRDACGVAIGHIAGHKVVERVDPDTGHKIIEVNPVIAYDLVLRVVPPRGGEIEFAQVRELIIRLRDNYGLPIKYLTYDGFNSVDSRQIMKAHRFQTDYLSVEKPEPWKSLRDMLYDGRILLPNHQWLATELAELERTVKNNKEKIDHRPQGTKDVADAVCGVAQFLTTRKAAWAGLSHERRVGVHLLGNPNFRLANAPAFSEDEIAQHETDPSNVKHRGRSPLTRRSITRRAVQRS